MVTYRKISNISPFEKISIKLRIYFKFVFNLLIYKFIPQLKNQDRQKTIDSTPPHLLVQKKEESIL